MIAYSSRSHNFFVVKFFFVLKEDLAACGVYLATEKAEGSGLTSSVVTQKGESLIFNVVIDVFECLKVTIFFEDVFELNIVLAILWIDFMAEELLESIPNSDFDQYQNDKIKPDTEPNILSRIIFTEKISPKRSRDTFERLFEQNNVEIVVGVDVLNEGKVA